MAGLDEVSEMELNNFESMLQNRAQELLQCLDIGDFTNAMKILAELSEARNTMLYQEVGRLTRGLHEAIKEFNIDVQQSASLEQSKAGGDLNEVANANERLNYVLELTENAANTTLDMVDNSIPIAEELGTQAKLLRQDWKAMADAKTTLAELKDLGRTTETFLQEIEKGTDTLNKNFTEILLAQGYQDLTGQLIKRVIGLVNDVERNLVNLVAVAGQVDRIRGNVTESEETQDAQSKAAEEEQKLIKGHGPQMKAADGTSDVVAGQDEVDDLLSSLGF